VCDERLRPLGLLFRIAGPSTDVRDAIVAKAENAVEPEKSPLQHLLDPGLGQLLPGALSLISQRACAHPASLESRNAWRLRSATGYSVNKSCESPLSGRMIEDRTLTRKQYEPVNGI